VNGEQGSVVLDVKISSEGKVRNIKVDRSSGFDDLDNAAIEGVLGWHFVPAMDDGEASTEWTKLTVTYKLPTLPAPPQGTPAPPAR
jgi:protein TonB